MLVSLCTGIRAVYFSQLHSSNMIKGIIFDFNRTLYDPDNHRVFRGVRGLLGRLYKKFSLSLVTTEAVDRSYVLEGNKLVSFFKCIESVDEKTPEIFLECCREMQLEPSEVVAVGDRIRGEIVAANKAGMKTIWLKRGKFANEFPENDNEKPNFIIADLKELEEIVSKMEDNRKV